VSARVIVEVDGQAVTVRIRHMGACTCGTTDDVHDAACSVLEPGTVDLYLDGAVRARRPWWHRRYKR
jgi:hypothetical protein